MLDRSAVASKIARIVLISAVGFQLMMISFVLIGYHVHAIKWAQPVMIAIPVICIPTSYIACMSNETSFRMLDAIVAFFFTATVALIYFSLHSL